MDFAPITPVPPPEPAELAAWLRLTLTRGVGNATIARLVAHCGGPAAIFDAPVAELRGLVTAAQLAYLRQVPAELEALVTRTQRWLEAWQKPSVFNDVGQVHPNASAHALITLGDVRYPSSLLEMADPPLLLHAVGPARWVLADTPFIAPAQCLSMVGARSASAQGMENARQFAHELAASGFCVVSGLASGIDAAAHEGALAAVEKNTHPDAARAHAHTGGDAHSASSGLLRPTSDKADLGRGADIAATWPPLGEDGGNWTHFPATIAVIGTGADRVYPASHRELSHRIATHGLILSEFPLGTPPLPANFPKRNRIISALSAGTLVVEAAVASGSLITARLAAEQGREVFAIPGSIHSPLARGPHALIRQGAKLVESVHDICEELAAAHPSGPAAAVEARWQLKMQETSPRKSAKKSPTKSTSKTQSKSFENTIENQAQNPPSSPIFKPNSQPSLLNAAPTDNIHPILKALGHEAANLDTLALRTGLDAASLQAQLLELEIDGKIATQAGGLFIRT